MVRSIFLWEEILRSLLLVDTGAVVSLESNKRANKGSEEDHTPERITGRLSKKQGSLMR